MVWVRVDNRLVHGQVIETWLPYVSARTLIVANNDLAGDYLRQEIMKLAIPSGVALVFSSVEAVPETVHDLGKREDRGILVLFADCCDARDAFVHGFEFESINIGNLHYGPGKQQICDHVALSDRDSACLHFFSREGVKIDFRCVPNKTVKVGKW
ncbi:MAG TPA: PTS sugar transporter subunit IIB [Desulfomicrobiaceae bacterium]|jgi:PTS system mannose-specific IIB component|nr:PTS sugar transporter subunit IIB [Desulfomicrobiaceae bacterium]